MAYMEQNIIHLYFKGTRKLSICQNWIDGKRVSQEVLEITDGFGGDPVRYGSTVEDLIRALQQFVEED